MCSHADQDERPCFMPPHPDYFKNAAAEDGESLLPTGEKLQPLSLPTGNVLGMNDGVIFPPSHFDETPSQSTLIRAALDRAPLRNQLRVAIVLVDFPDKHMDAQHSTAHFQKLFFQPGGVGYGSVSEYYATVSNQNISLAGEVVGPYRMPHPKSYYANNSSGNGGPNGARPNTRDLADDALTASLAHFKDLGPYDNDKNGYVDAFIVVHAGTGAEASGKKDDIWSVKWVLPNPRKVGSATVYGFLTIPEDCQVGVCAHELGHLLFGWPDLYDTDYSSAGIGNWCLMSGGSWGGNPAGSKPVHPSAWCKANQKWVSVVNETANRPISIQDVKKNASIHRVWTHGDTNSKEYFLLENRQQSGNDASLPGPGLLSWHIDDSVDSNANEAHRKVDLMQADGLAQLESHSSGRGDAGDPYPGTAHNSNFGPSTKPSSHSYAGHDTHVSVTKITPTGSGTGTSYNMNVAVA